jgi:hypothetical protein
MKIICRENCSGKTRELIRESIDTNTPILVFSPTKQRSLEEKSRVYFNEFVETITLEDAKSYQGKVLIDDIDKNIDLLVKFALNNPNIDVGAVTLSS